MSSFQKRARVVFTLAIVDGRRSRIAAVTYLERFECKSSEEVKMSFRGNPYTLSGHTPNFVESQLRLFEDFWLCLHVNRA